ncbi:Zinc finger CCHC-type superfamily [Arabidopsis thaliana x Arabidopsis arenosa]|uniref:Zinc finger CCHC-type superfamily n=1 Tax=Arabidopsis thaliana x Arabidopsis arenosa TaxID=1240361 RepID=A0A8T1ZRH8_9BRAS|nr:Zinc finger CCHC-type superfamily [Arabidopsis thaliana x Arabidopsis arenosa]
MESYKEGTSMTRPPLLDSANYGYWKVRMQAFISNLDEDCWNSIELGWEAPKVTDDDGVVSLKPRDKWTAAEKKLSSCNSKAKTAIYNAIDSSRFKLISQCASAQKAWKTLENMFEGTTSVKRTKLDMLASQFENLRMEEEETVADFSAKLCDISNESFALGKVYKDKKLVKKLKRSLPAKFESKISAVEEAHNLDEMAFDEFVGILQAFELSKAYETKGKMKKVDEVKKEVDIGVALKGSSTEDSMAMLSRQFTKYLKRKGKERKDRIDEDLRSSSKNVQCFECKGYGHVRSECANLQKHKKKAMNVVTSDSETDSDEEEEDLKNFVAFTTFDPSSDTDSASVSASASATSENDECESDAESIDDEEFAENYRALYEHWLKMVEENSVLTKEKLKLEAKVIEAQKYAAEKEEEASQAKVQLEETQKNLRMLNNGTKKLDHILNIGKTDKCGLGFEGKLPKSDPVFVYGGKITSGSGSVSETATVAETASALRKNPELKNAPQRIFRPVCHHCGVVGHIRPRCFRLLRERNRMENAYDVRFHGPTCYHCGVQGHIKRNCFRFIRESSHEGLRRRKIWVRKDDFYGGGVLGYQPRIAKRGELSK